MRYSLCLIDLFLQLTLQSHYQETTRQTTIHFLSTCATQSCNFINYSKWQSDSATFERRLLYKLGMMSQNNKSKRFAQWLHLQGHQYSKPRMGATGGGGDDGHALGLAVSFSGQFLMGPCGVGQSIMNVHYFFIIFSSSSFSFFFIHFKQLLYDCPDIDDLACTRTCIDAYIRTSNYSTRPFITYIQTTH